MELVSGYKFSVKHPSGLRGYLTFSARENAIKSLAKRGFNYFVCFHDVQRPYALQYSVVPDQNFVSVMR